jgi:hypothetical protein
MLLPFFSRLRRREIAGNQDIAEPMKLSKSLDAPTTLIGSEMVTALCYNRATQGGNDDRTKFCKSWTLCSFVPFFCAPGAAH